MERERAIELIRSSNLSAHAELLIHHLMPSARLILQEAGAVPKSGGLASHFGGIPFMPVDFTWPSFDRGEKLKGQIAHFEERYRDNPRAIGLRDMAVQMRKDLTRGPLPLAFLGQLRLNDIRVNAQLAEWPSEGSLAFFYDQSQSWGFDPLDRGHCFVHYFPAHAELHPCNLPPGLPDELKFRERTVTVQREWTLPTRLITDDRELTVWDDDDSYRKLCEQLMPSSDEGHVHRCGGHPQEIQGDMRLECQLVTNGIYCGDSSGYRDPRVAVLEQGATDWQLLLQLDSDEKRLGWMWGDSGRLYFWARRQDVEAADFAGAWAVLQCY